MANKIPRDITIQRAASGLRIIYHPKRKSIPFFLASGVGWLVFHQIISYSEYINGLVPFTASFMLMVVGVDRQITKVIFDVSPSTPSSGEPFRDAQGGVLLLYCRSSTSGEPKSVHTSEGLRGIQCLLREEPSERYELNAIYHDQRVEPLLGLFEDAETAIYIAQLLESELLRQR